MLGHPHPHTATIAASSLNLTHHHTYQGKSHANPLKHPPTRNTLNQKCITVSVAADYAPQEGASEYLAQKKGRRGWRPNALQRDDQQLNLMEVSVQPNPGMHANWHRLIAGKRQSDQEITVQPPLL